jgi:hypothetical protein
MKKSAYYRFLLIGLLILILGTIIVFYFVTREGKGEAEKTTTQIIFGIPLGLVCFWTGILFVVLAGKYWGYGQPKVFLPDKGRFEKFSEELHVGKMEVYLWLKELEEVKFQLISYRIPASLILNEAGDPWSWPEKLPERFSVRIAKRIKEGEEFKKRPRLEEVYYLVPLDSID